MINKIILCYILFVLFPAQLCSQDYGISFKVSSMGPSLEGLRKITDNLNGRIGISYFSLKVSGGSSTEDFDYRGDAKYFSASFLVDYYPFQNNLKVTGGIFLNFNKGQLTLTPNQTYTFGKSIYTPAILGNVAADIKFNIISPYLGIGLGNFMIYEKLLFSLDLGTIYQGAPEVNLSAHGLLEPTAEQEPKINDNLNWFKFYPVIALGIIYIF